MERTFLNGLRNSEDLVAELQRQDEKFEELFQMLRELPQDIEALVANEFLEALEQACMVHATSPLVQNLGFAVRA